MLYKAVLRIHYPGPWTRTGTSDYGSWYFFQ
jgi:hypothetical protein